MIVKNFLSAFPYHPRELTHKGKIVNEPVPVPEPEMKKM
jgi:hypothetical protein